MESVLSKQTIDKAYVVELYELWLNGGYSLCLVLVGYPKMEIDKFHCCKRKAKAARFLVTCSLCLGNILFS